MNTKKLILVTGFEPFGGDAVNPTQMILDRLPDTVGDYRVYRLLLPVEFRRAPQLAAEACDALSPAAVILLGQAGGRAAITPETTAKNRADTTKPDNAVDTPASAVLVPGAPDTLPATLPIEAIIDAIRSCGIPAEASDDAGGYVCNCLLYRMLLHNRGDVPTGFIHVPYIREQGHDDKPSLTFDEVYTGVLAAIRAVTDAVQSAV